MGAREQAGSRRQYLAISGGDPVHVRADWPTWPQPSADVARNLTEVCTSGRWAVSGSWTGTPSFEERFAEAFAAFNEVRYCVPTDHGSSSLSIALEALDVGAGDEVILPVLTWVATASAVVNVNAIPVFVDVDPETCCMDAAAIEAAVTVRTRAIIVVHLHWLMADMDAVMEVANRHGLPVVEDCAQAHGARWRGRRAGTIGTLGTFSTQQGKVLSSGEGGAVITDDRLLFERASELRADSRRYGDGEPRIGRLQLVETANVFGGNFCLSEFGAAVLLAQLEVLEDQNRIREANARYLAAALSTLETFSPLPIRAAQDELSVYEYAIRVDPARLGVSVQAVCGALEAELGLWMYAPDAPLHRSRLFRPLSKRRHRLEPEYVSRLESIAEGRFPNADRAAETLILFHHSALLADRAMVAGIVDACAKVERHADELRAA